MRGASPAPGPKFEADDKTSARKQGKSRSFEPSAALVDTALPRPPAPASVVFRRRGFAAYWTARMLLSFAVQVISVAVGWQVYDITRDPLDLGIVGLVQFLPSLLLVLVTGSVADHFSRRAILAICIVAEIGCAAALLALTVGGNRDVMPIFAVLLGLGIARAFVGPAVQSLLPNVVTLEELPTAVAWNSSAWQVATILGPVAGGLLYGISASVAYGTAAFLLLLALGLVALIVTVRPQEPGERASWSTVVAGFAYVWRNKILLGAISLDLFAVLLGGAVALMPAYARDILDVGPWGLGLLRAAPGIGAIAVAAYLGMRPIRDHAGIVMFIGVGFFGFFTVVFGLSTLPWLSIAALLLMGAADMLSVYVREILIQLATPDEVRGRVNAVNMVFVGASNELGEFRAGVSAALIGIVPAVVFGGLGTMAVTALWARLFPALRRARRLDGPPPT
jgi:MFS family permease